MFACSVLVVHYITPCQPDRQSAQSAILEWTGCRLTLDFRPIRPGV